MQMIEYEVYHFEKVKLAKTSSHWLYPVIGGCIGLVILSFFVFKKNIQKPARTVAKSVTRTQVAPPPVNPPQVIKHDGQVFVITKGQAVAVTDTLKLSNGTSISTTGQVTYPSGTTATIDNNQAVYSDGSIGYQTSGSVNYPSPPNNTPTPTPLVTLTPTTGVLPTSTIMPSPTLPGLTNTPAPTSPLPTPTDIPIPTGRSTVVTLLPVDNSGQSGSAAIAEINNQVKVQVSVSGGVYPSQPTDLRSGGCPDGGNKLYTLANTQYGYGQSVVNVTYDQLLTQRPMALSLHYSAFQINTATACGSMP